MTENKSLYVISLGCAKNLVDTEHMLGILAEEGYHVVSDIKKARYAVINTCGFLQEAVEEAIDNILDTARLKQSGSLEKLVVTGCMVQRYGYKLQKELPEVDGWLGTGQIHRIGDLLRPKSQLENSMLINRPSFCADHHLPRIQATPFYTAYLRIAEGCANRCAYCMIPKLRGPFRSRSMDALLEEASRMAIHGVKEINLIAQDTSRYGEDLYGKSRIRDLLAGLSRIERLHWIRLLYFHPARLTEEMLDFMDENDGMVSYLDLPFQHCNAALLKAMNRGSGEKTPQQIIQMVRNRKKRIHTRTSLMVGFPGETEARFKELCDFVEMAQFDHLGVFIFSPEKGTAAARFPHQVPFETAQNRRKHLMTLQARISKGLNQQQVGLVLPVLIEGKSPDTELLLSGRTAAMAPDVDGRVLINDGEGIMGDIAPVRITQAHEYDLVGAIVSSTENRL